MPRIEKRLPLDLTRARIELKKLERMEAQAWPQLADALWTVLQSLSGIECRPRPLRPEAFDSIVANFRHSTTGNPLLLGVHTKSLTRKTRGHFGVRRLAGARMHVEGRSAESAYVVLESTLTAGRRRWQFDQRLVPIVLSRHAMKRYLMRRGQNLRQFQRSIDIALLSIRAWLQAAAYHLSVLPVSVAVPIESGAVLGLPYVFQARESWCSRLECSRGELRTSEEPKKPMLGVSLRTFIHEDMFSDLQEEKLTAVKDLGRQLICAVREHKLSESEALVSPPPRISEMLEALFATTTDREWRAAFTCPTKGTGHAFLTYDK